VHTYEPTFSVLSLDFPCQMQSAASRARRVIIAL